VFASTLDRTEWVVTWIHLDRDDLPVCVRLEGEIKKARKIYRRSSDEIFDILDEVDESMQQIVFLDGYTLNGPKHINFLQTCYLWLKNDTAKRRLVVVCSMSSRYKATKEKDILLNLEEFYVYSWKEEGYLDAIRNPDFFSHVKSGLDANVKLASSPEDLVMSKLYFAGICARWMFLYPTKEVIKHTEESVSAITVYCRTSGAQLETSRIMRFCGLILSSQLFAGLMLITSNICKGLINLSLCPE
jgi:hypothetical protein